MNALLNFSDAFIRLWLGLAKLYSIPISEVIESDIFYYVGYLELVICLGTKICYRLHQLFCVLGGSAG